MKYKVGDKVRIKSLDWYNKNKNSNGDVVVLSIVPHFSWREKVRTVFTKDMVKFCGKVVTIESAWSVNYSIVEGTYRDGINIDYFTDEMIEGLVEEEIKPLTYEETVEIIEAMQGIGDSWECPQGYQFVDENGNVINATKIVLEKKKKEYPKSFGECCKVLGTHSYNQSIVGYKNELFSALQKLLICRDAYWKIAGEEMGLGKPWEPDWSDEDETKWVIFNLQNKIKLATRDVVNAILAFPTEEMRDAFYENFKELIESCKELL